MQAKSHKQISQRNPALDGLKAVAMFLILMYYFYQHILPGGYLAVNIFLLVAGFLNFRHFYKANIQGLKVQPLSYYKRRFKRLFFPMVFMILAVASWILVFARDYLFNLRNMAVSSLFFVNNFYQIVNEQSYFIQAANPSAYTHLWYVSLLGQMILLTPLLHALFFSWHKRPHIAINMLVIFSMVSAFLLGYWYSGDSDPSRVYYHLLTRIFAYTLGGALGYFYPVKEGFRPLKTRAKIWINLISLLTGVLLFLMLKFMYGTQAFAYHLGMALFTLVFMVFFLCVLNPQTLLHKVLALKPLAWIGRRTLSIYLWYYPIYLILPNHIFSFPLTLAQGTAFKVLLTLLLAELSYRLFEQDQLSLPLGQDFNLKKTWHQVQVLWRSGRDLLLIKFLTLGYGLFLVLGIISLAIAPEERQAQANDLQHVIQQNQEIISQSQTQDQVMVINNIPGLSQEELLYANGLEVTFIGDSTLLAAADQIASVFPKAVIDAEIGRQLYNSYSVLEDLEEAGRLKPTVVSLLGSNGTFTSGQVNDYIAAIGSDRQQYFVTSNAIRNWVPDANREIRAAGDRFGHVHVIDWQVYAQDHPEWLREDAAHPTPAGAEEMAVFIAKELYRLR